MSLLTYMGLLLTTYKLMLSLFKKGFDVLLMYMFNLILNIYILQLMTFCNPRV